MPSHLTRLYDHLVWADYQTFASLKGLTSERGVSLFAHLVASEHVWISRIEGSTRPQLPVWPDFSLDACRFWLEDNHERLRPLMTSPDPEVLSRSVRYVNSAGDEFVSIVSDILLHVAMHGSYHRGQIASVVRTAGGQPASTDFIAFARGAPAATRQDP